MRSVASALGVRLLGCLVLAWISPDTGAHPLFPPFLCADTADNDFDGLIDYPDDPGCSDPADSSENTVFECSDGSDNDLDLAIDYLADRSCYAENDPSEASACADGADNDADGFIDYPVDSDCSDVWDETESSAPPCADLRDNDGDSLVDFPDDPGCLGAFDDTETAVLPSQASDARILFAVATSGSLNGNICSGTFAGGDGSLECPGSDVACALCASPGCGNGAPDDSRLFQIKSALAALFLRPEVESALLRSHQRAAPMSCPTASPLSASGGWQGGGDLCGGDFDLGEPMVVFGDDNYSALAGLLDGESNTTAGPAPAGFDFELRASGGRPLAGLLSAAASTIAAASATDPAAGCRPYAVALIADGSETCSGDPVAAASLLFAAGVPVTVLGFAVQDAGAQAGLNAIALAGGTGAATFVASAADAAAVLAALAESTTLTESCNGLDDDCDGEIDDGFPSLGQACDNGQLGACRRSGALVCGGPNEIVCNAPPPVSGTPEICNRIDDDCDGQVDEGGVCVPTAELCNGIDDDGDGEADEDFPVGQPCTDGGVGVCRSSGTYVCTPDHTWVECLITQPGQTAAPLDSACNGLDDDCDGYVDEEAFGEMVVVADGASSFVIDRFEASRPDASAWDQGYLQSRACSRPDVLPWTRVTWPAAAAACAAAQKRLCAESEWQAACQGPQLRTYPYGFAYDPEACNGEDFDADCSGNDDDLLLPAGTAYGCPPPGASRCASAAGALDLSGNAAEWTATDSGPSNEREIRGGAFDSQPPALTCTHSGYSLPLDAFRPTLGFRCCADALPVPTLPFRDGFESGSSAGWSVTVP